MNDGATNVALAFDVGRRYEQDEQFLRKRTMR